MSEIGSLLRLLVQADKEYSVTSVTVLGSATEFTTHLSSGYKRKALLAYNNSNASSGEVVWGASTVTASNGMLIPKYCVVDIPVSSDLSVYFANTVSGERSDLRVLELA